MAEIPKTPDWRLYRDCEHCGESFKTVKTHLGRTKYCSQECFGLATRVRETRECVMCGTAYEAIRCRTRKTCSDKCSRKLRAQSKTGPRNPHYRDGRGSARWHGSKESCCRLCGGTNRLTLHHVVYEQHVRKAGGDCWDPANGFTVCFACHMRHHQGMDHRIPIAKLRPENIAFASALLGAWVGDYFARYYDQRTGREPWLEEGSSLAA